jgi:pimeloyl-ACP methyl ester carboxylesterase
VIESRPPRWRRRIRLVALGFGGLLASCSTLGLAVQSIATWKAPRDFPPPGERFDVGGYELHLLCSGPPNGPTVVLESGFAGWTVDWVELQPVVARNHRVCSYDRAGFGWSERGPRRDADAAGIAHALRRLLEEADVPGPFILVGHSLGGIYVRQFAHDFADEVAGIVLLDSSHEDIVHRLPREQVDEQLDQLRLLRVARYLTPIGIQRLLRKPLANVDDLTPEWWRRAGVALGYRADSYFAAYDQIEALVDASKAGNLPVPDVPPVPLRVLYSGGAMEEYGAAWREVQEELVALSPDHRLTYLPDAGHDIQRDATQAVADVIDEVARNGR